MDFVLNDISNFVYITNWDQASWDEKYPSIPWNYTIQIDPPIPDFQIALLNTGRELKYSYVTGYQFTYTENGMVSTPIEVQIQQLLPLESDPASSGADQVSPS